MFKGLIVQAKEDEAQAEVVLAVGIARFDAHGLAIQHEGANVVALHFIHFAKGVGGDVIIPGHVQRVEEQGFAIAPIIDLHHCGQHAAEQGAAAEER